MGMKIYLAGASQEHEQASQFMAKLREIGHVITHDWTESIREHGSGNDHKVNHGTRAYHSDKDLGGIEDAEAFWLVCPSEENSTKGAWVELGYALAYLRLLRRVRKMIVVVSGFHGQCIFTSLAMYRFEKHNDALAWFGNPSLHYYQSDPYHEDSLPQK